MALLPFYWCFNEVSLFPPWCFGGLSRALLVLIIVDFVILVGKGVVMVYSELVLDELLSLFRYPSKSSGALLAGSLPLRYCSSKFASRTPFWVLTCSWPCCRVGFGSGSGCSGWWS